MNKYKLSFLDSIGYYGTVILSFGGAWLIKTIIAKAIVDAFNSDNQMQKI